MPGNPQLKSPEAQLSEVFGNYRAEWLKDRLFRFFKRPQYLSELESATPVILEGGRGSGKTTVLRCMEYRGRFEAAGHFFEKLPYFGVYYRVDTARVRAFEGPELEEREWVRLFSHYINLLLAEKLLRMAVWVEEVSGKALPVNCLDSIGATLGGELAEPSWRSVYQFAKQSLIKLENYVNNINSSARPHVTMARAPIEEIVKALNSAEMCKEKMFFVLIDEYENLLDYQQRVWNTYVKHCEFPISYKIGVKTGGRRVRETLGEDEVLEDPADFSLVLIEDSLKDDFSSFAKGVCEERLGYIFKNLGMESQPLGELLPGLTSEEEAERLGIGKFAEDVRELLAHKHGIDAAWIRRRRNIELLLIKFWADSSGKSISSAAHDFLKNPGVWEQRLTNYGYPLLFYITKGKRGGAMRKYYCGIDTFETLSNNNIRFFLELVARSFLLHFRAKNEITQPVDPKTQTYAAREIGKKVLFEMERVSRLGGSVKKLLLSLGRIFQVMAHSPGGHTPEVTCFVIRDGVADQHCGHIEEVLYEAWSHLALLRLPATKPTGVGDTKSDEYMLHPILAPYFEISERRKRHFVLAWDEIQGLIDSPRRTIPIILEKQGRKEMSPLPAQMKLFRNFYVGEPNGEPSVTDKAN